MARFTTVTKLAKRLKNGIKGDEMEVWNIVTTLVTVACIGVVGYVAGYTVRDMEAKQSHKKALKRG
ncbi:hypothetical protein IV71_GL000215 [Fructobacillus fructosus KCTC 3544]|uniref:hypothetical protein n=1 Tax=Fructobacillus fructosus TaxID=1631 RepID=UPI0002DBA9CC|nr:hypothetical protein [Fructobacillus fructosus]KRN52067.1 hypothetical protein IV71_GL000215 [Fructobacillus fructosus KCTC 3544]